MGAVLRADDRAGPRCRDAGTNPLTPGGARCRFRRIIAELQHITVIGQLLAYRKLGTRRARMAKEPMVACGFVDSAKHRVPRPSIHSGSQMRSNLGEDYHIGIRELV